MSLSGGPTQDEILAISLSKLSPQKNEIMVDIGCGTGKVSVAASRLVKKVIAIDRRREAINYSKTEIEASGAKNIELVAGEAAEILTRVENPDCAFIGGSGNIETVLELLVTTGCKSGVINAVLLNTVTKAMNTMKKLGIFEEIVHVQVSYSYTLAGDIMLKPKNPVYIIVGRRE